MIFFLSVSMHFPCLHIFLCGLNDGIKSNHTGDCGSTNCRYTRCTKSNQTEKYIKEKRESGARRIVGCKPVVRELNIGFSKALRCFNGRFPVEYAVDDERRLPVESLWYMRGETWKGDSKARENWVLWIKLPLTDRGTDEMIERRRHFCFSHQEVS